MYVLVCSLRWFGVLGSCFVMFFAEDALGLGSASCFLGGSFCQKSAPLDFGPLPPQHPHFEGQVAAHFFKHNILFLSSWLSNVQVSLFTVCWLSICSFPCLTHPSGFHVYCPSRGFPWRLLFACLSMISVRNKWPAKWRMAFMPFDPESCAPWPKLECD